MAGTSPFFTRNITQLLHFPESVTAEMTVEVPTTEEPTTETPSTEELTTEEPTTEEPAPEKLTEIELSLDEIKREVLTVSVGTEDGMVYYGVASSGNFGPRSFAVEGDTVYILDTYNSRKR